MDRFKEWCGHDCDRESILKITDLKTVYKIEHSLSNMPIQPDDPDNAEYWNILNFLSCRAEDLICSKTVENYQSGKWRVLNKEIVDYYLTVRGIDLTEQYELFMLEVQIARKDFSDPYQMERAMNKLGAMVGKFPHRQRARKRTGKRYAGVF